MWIKTPLHGPVSCPGSTVLEALCSISVFFSRILLNWWSSCPKSSIVTTEQMTTSPSLADDLHSATACLLFIWLSIRSVTGQKTAVGKLFLSGSDSFWPAVWTESSLRSELRAHQTSSFSVWTTASAQSADKAWNIRDNCCFSKLLTRSFSLLFLVSGHFLVIFVCVDVWFNSTGCFLTLFCSTPFWMKACFPCGLQAWTLDQQL